MGGNSDVDRQSQQLFDDLEKTFFGCHWNVDDQQFNAEFAAECFEFVESVEAMQVSEGAAPPLRV